MSVARCNGLLILMLLAARADAQTSDTLVSSELIVPARFASLFDSAHSVLLPPGYRCNVYYAAKLWNPRALAIRSDGVVCASDNLNSRIVALRGNDFDHAADSALTIAVDDSAAHGFAFYKGALYTAAQNFVRKYEHPNSVGFYQDSSIFIANIPYQSEGAPNHTSRTILFDTIGGSIFLSIGAPCNACREVATERAAILRFRLDGTGRRIYASGLRNAVGLAMDNRSHTLWASVAERNSQGADLPEEFATPILDGGFYGWPIAFGDHRWDDFTATSEYSKLLPITSVDSSSVRSMQVADLFFPAHSTPLGIAVYENKKFPGCDSSIFVTLHGSYQGADGRIVANGSKIERARLVDSKWVITDFASGFLTDSIAYKRWARPCGIVIDTAGDLFFTSDYSDAHTPPAVYRISYDAKNRVESQSGSKSALEVFPDPVRSRCTVRVSGIGRTPKLVLINSTGNVIYERVYSSASDEVVLDLGRLPSGDYILRAIGANQTMDRRISVIH